MAGARRRQSSGFTSPQSNSDVERLRQEVERQVVVLRLLISELEAEVAAIDTSGGGGGAPTNASYVTIANNGTLTDERRLAAGTGITITDGGANSTVTIATSSSPVTQEQVEDWVAGLIDDTASVTWSYNDAGGSLTATVAAEYVRDTIATALVEGHAIDITVDDPGDTITVLVDESELDLWEQVRDIDCAAQANNDWNAGGDGTYSLGGLTWNIVNTGVADTLGPNGSTGVRFNSTAGTTTVFNNTSRTATHMWIAGTTLLPNFDPLSAYVVEFYYSSITLAASSDEIGVFFWNSSSNRVVRAGRRFSATQQTMLMLDANTQGTTYTDDAFALRIDAATASIASGTYAAGFPSPYPRMSSVTMMGTNQPIASPIFDPTNLRIGFAWVSNTAGNADSTLARIRVWQRRGIFG